MEQTQDGGGVSAEAEAQSRASHTPRNQVSNSHLSPLWFCLTFVTPVPKPHIITLQPLMLLGSGCRIRDAMANPLCCRPAARWLPSLTILDVSRCWTCPGACACACGRVRPTPTSLILLTDHPFNRLAPLSCLPPLPHRLQGCPAWLAAGSRGARPHSQLLALPLSTSPPPCPLFGYLRPPEGDPGSVGHAAGAPRRGLHCGQTLQVEKDTPISSNVTKDRDTNTSITIVTIINSPSPSFAPSPLPLFL